MKFYLATSLIFFLSLTKLYADPIKLKDHYKVKATFSGKINDEDSFHLIAAKNSKTDLFDIIPSFFYFNKQELIRYEPFSFSSEPSLLSYHNFKNTLTLLFSFIKDKEDLIRIIDINTNTGRLINSNDIPKNKDNLEVVFPQKHNSFLVYKEQETLKILNILSSNSIHNIKVKSTTKTKPFIQAIAKHGIDAIDNLEYIKHGSIKRVKLYFANSNLIITEDIQKTNTTELLQIPIDTSNSNSIKTARVFHNKDRGIFKKLASFVFENNLYQFKTDKTKGGSIVNYNIHDGSTSEIKFTIDQINNKGKRFKGLEKFYTKASRANSKPTITVNKTISGNALLRLDYVLKNNYGYHNNFLFQQQLLFHQQSLPQFHGPNVESLNTNLLYNFEIFEELGDAFFILLNSKNEIISNVNYNLINSAVDKYKYIESVTAIYNYEYHSGIFITDHYRYFVYNKKTGAFHVYKKNTND